MVVVTVISVACAIIRQIITPFMCSDSANEVVNCGDIDAFDDNNVDAKEYPGEA